MIRVGAGVFFLRFDSNAVLEARRQNGVTERDVVISNPDFYPTVCSSDPAACSGVPQKAPTIYQVNPSLRAPYSITTNLGIDKPLGKYASVSVNYQLTRGDHQFLTRNINAPLPGTYNPADPTSGTRPLGIDQNIYQYNSQGASFGQRLNINGNLHTKRSGLFGFYRLGKVEADSSGLGSFPSNQYDPMQDYGRASWDVRNRAFLGGYTRLPFHFSVNPFFIVQSSRPFNIVVGQDLNGDTQFNDRPAFATDLTRPSVVKTNWGTLDTDPLPGQRPIPMNYGKGPGTLMANLRLNRSFNFGPKMPEPPAPPPPAAVAPKEAKPAQPAAVPASGSKTGTSATPAAGSTPASSGASKPAPAPAPPPAPAATPSAPAPAANAPQAAAAKAPAKPEKKEIERRYTLVFGIAANNILNHPNFAQPVGVLGSPLFGTSTALANLWGNASADRSISIETMFRF